MLGWLPSCQPGCTSIPAFTNHSNHLPGPPAGIATTRQTGRLSSPQARPRLALTTSLLGRMPASDALASLPAKKTSIAAFNPPDKPTRDEQLVPHEGRLTNGGSSVSLQPPPDCDPAPTVFGSNPPSASSHPGPLPGFRAGLVSVEPAWPHLRVSLCQFISSLARLTSGDHYSFATGAAQYTPGEVTPHPNDARTRTYASL